MPPSCPIDERTLRATTRVGSGLVFIATSPWPNVPNVNGPGKGKSECSCKCSQYSHLQPPGNRQHTGRAGTWNRLKWRTLCELGVSIAPQNEGRLTDCPNACMEDHKWTPDVHTHRNIWGYDLHNRTEKVPVSNANESAPINAYLALLTGERIAAAFGSLSSLGIASQLWWEEIRRLWRLFNRAWTTDKKDAYPWRATS
jgi:hypothetical protein